MKTTFRLNVFEVLIAGWIGGFSPLAQADALPSPSPPNPPPSLDAVVAQLADEVSGSFGEFKRDVFVYHWGPRSYFLNDQEVVMKIDSPLGLDYIQRKILWTYRPEKNRGGMMGTSFYASVDPAATQGYGDTLAEIRLPEKARYLDTRGNNPSLSQDLRSKLMELGCSTSYLTSLISSSNGSKCKEVATRLFEVLHISAVAYGYSSSSFKECSNQSSTAFILVNPSLGDAKHAHILTPGSAPDSAGDPERARVQEFYKLDQYRQKSFMERNFGMNPLWSFVGSPKVEIKDWVQEHMFACDLAKHPEDAIKGPEKKPLPPLDFKAKTPSWKHFPFVGDEPMCPAPNPAAPILDPVMKCIEASDPALMDVE